MAGSKLVRDLIPNILLAKGSDCYTEVATGRFHYHRVLLDKLFEEIGEYIASRESEELADIAEVITALLNERKLTWDGLFCEGAESYIDADQPEGYFIQLLKQRANAYKAYDDVTTLADLAALVFFIAGRSGIDSKKLHDLRLAKVDQRGGFSKRLIWFPEGKPPEEVEGF